MDDTRLETLTRDEEVEHLNRDIEATTSMSSKYVDKIETDGIE